MWVRGSCFSTCARPRVTLPYIHSLLDIPPTLSSYIVHIRIFIYIYKRRQLNFSCAYTWPHADSYAARDACPRVSLSLSMLLRIGCNIRVRSNVCAWCAHVCMNVRVYMCVCEVGYDARRRQSAFGRKQVPACRVPRGRLDSNTMEAGPWVRGCLLSSPFRYPLCVTLSLSLSLHPTDNQYAGRPVLSPAKSSFSHVPSFPFFPSNPFPFQSSLELNSSQHRSLRLGFIRDIYISLSFSCSGFRYLRRIGNCIV